MIRVAMFDLGMTLVDAGNKPFDHALEALTVIKGFKTTAAKPLCICLVSDFTLAEPPNAAQKARALFKQYLALLDPTGLRPYFEPVQKRVTLSTQAGAMKPDRAVFETALRRLQVRASLEECLLVTENAAHVKAARTRLHMKALQFKSAGSDQFDFDDWSQAPALVAHLIDPQHAVNTHAAMTAHLAAKGVELSKVEPAAAAGTFNIAGHVWHPVSLPGVAALQEVHVAVPVVGKVTRARKGQLHARVSRPTNEQIAEATAFAGSLAAHHQIAAHGATPAAGTTHEIVTDTKGQRRLVRKRFTAL